MGAERDSYFGKLADEAAEEEMSPGSVSKAEHWVRMGDYLETNNIPSHMVGISIRDAVESRLEEKLGEPVSINTAHFFTTMSDHGWTRSKKGITPEPEPILVPVNVKFCAALDHIIDHAKFMKEVASDLRDGDGEMMEMHEVVGRHQYEAFCRQMSQLARVAKDYANQKLKVPPTMHQLFREVLKSNSGMLQAGRVFQKVRMMMLVRATKWITKKQAAKVEGMVEANMIPLYIPKDRDMAVFLGWYGLKCPDCGSWLVRESSDSTSNELECLGCGGEFTGYTVSHCPRCRRLIYLEDVPAIAESGRCPECNHYIRMPKDLVAMAG